MLRKALLVYISCFALAHILAGCNCPPAAHYRYHWTDMKLNTKGYVIADRKVQQDADSSTDFSHRELMLEVRPQYELLALQQRTTLGWTNAAYALKCINAVYTTDRHIMQLRVLSLRPYDAAHPALSDITEYFRSTSHDDKGWVTGLGPLNLGLPQSAKSSWSVDDYYRLFLAVKPTPGSQQIFEVELLLSDSSKIVAQTAEMQF